MYDILVNFPKQIKDAIKIGEKSPTFNNPLTSKNFVVLGMGGSAIGGDLVKSFVSTLPDCKMFICLLTAIIRLIFQ
jgi:glucose-6-phosphate isomerase